MFSPLPVWESQALCVGGQAWNQTRRMPFLGPLRTQTQWLAQFNDVAKLQECLFQVHDNTNTKIAHQHLNCVQLHSILFNCDCNCVGIPCVGGQALEKNAFSAFNVQCTQTQIAHQRLTMKSQMRSIPDGLFKHIAMSDAQLAVRFQKPCHCCFSSNLSDFL